MKYSYESHNIEHFGAIYKALQMAGFGDALILMNGHLDITVDGATQEQIDAAVTAASVGGLEEYRALKLATLTARSAELIDIGADSFEAGKKIPATKEALNDHSGTLAYYLDNPSAISTTSQLPMLTVDGDVIFAESIDDLKLVIKNIGDRLSYVYTAHNNADGSNGDYYMDGLIHAALTIEDIDDIMDTRT